MEARILGFEYRRISVGDAEYHVAIGGSGRAIVLLHGYRQMGYCWRSVAPKLAPSRTVIVPDIRGYGASEAPPGGPQGEGYSKREMAADVIAISTRSRSSGPQSSATIAAVESATGSHRPSRPRRAARRP